MAGVVAGILAMGAAPVAARTATCGVRAGFAQRPMAIALAVQGHGEAAHKEAGSNEFVDGFVSYILGDWDGAVRRMTAYAVKAQAMRPSRARDDALARAGYWAAEALSKSGKESEAAEMRRLVADRKGTFYALLVDAGTAMPGRKSYPTPQLAYTDPRASTALVYAITREESGFQTSVTSRTGAKGRMQMMWGTANRVASWVGMKADATKLNSDADYNTALGSTYLGWLMERYGGYAPLAAAGYNAGEGCADAWLERLGDPRRTVDPLVWIEAIPFDETREYVEHVTASMLVYMQQGMQSAGR